MRLVDMAKTPFHGKDHLNDVSSGQVYYGRWYLNTSNDDLNMSDGFTINCNEHGLMRVLGEHNVGKVYICVTCGVMGFALADFLDNVGV